VAATEPDTTTDAKQTLSALCGLLAWTDLTMGNLNPAQVVTESNVERWFQALEGSGTRSNLRARLRRIQRVLAGDEARTKRNPRPEGPPPYSPVELAALAETASASPALAAALALALVRGAVVPGARGARVPTRQEAEAVCTTRGLPDDWIRHLPQDRPESFLDEAWAQARGAADRADLSLLADRLRTTWLVSALDRFEPLTCLVPALSLSRADLERAQPFLPAADAETTRAALRG
jgi:hypothetical protein